MAEINSYPNNQNIEIGAENVMKWHHGRTSGVYGADAELAIAAVQGAMAVNLSDGNGWMSNGSGDGITWWIDYEKLNGSKLQLTIDPADSTLSRIDRIIIEWKMTNYVDLPEAKVLKGTLSSSPTPPALTNNNTVRQISLARISIAAGTTALTNSMITDERLNPAVCGIVTETVEADTSMINAQMQAILEETEIQAAAVFRSLQAELERFEKAIADAYDGVIADKSITRDKLANDAAYSPVVNVAESRDITPADFGKTLKVTTAGVVLTVPDELVASTAYGYWEVAVLKWPSAGIITIAQPENTEKYFVKEGYGSKSGRKVVMDENGAMCAIKKITNLTFLITGSGEVEEV